MGDLYPFIFDPILKERVWGGRRLEQLYRKPLPSGVPIGESWEISDRPGDGSVVANGPLAGRDLHWLVRHHQAELLGAVQPHGNRFPLLVKILDAREKLSLQVHPPAAKAAALGGEPKTEMWYIADAAPGAELYVGLKQGVTRRDFEEKLRSGTVAECFHRVSVQAGDAMFLPSGRVHAIGAGLVIFEIQQNSDTTYRVFDWNRVGLDGSPRPLHLPESLASIDFDDFEPALANHGGPVGTSGMRLLVKDPLFCVHWSALDAGATLRLDPGRMRILGLIGGSLVVESSHGPLALAAGRFCLVPAGCGSVELRASAPSAFLLAEAGTGV